MNTGPTLRVDLLRQDLVRDEDLRLKAYDDATGKELKPGDTLVGNVTVGVGCNLTTAGITAVEAYALLDNRVRLVLRDLDFRWPWWRRIPEPAQRGIANMCFNMGAAELGTFRQMLGALERGDWHEAARQVRASLYAHRAASRAERIATLYEECAAPPVAGALAD